MEAPPNGVQHQPVILPPNFHGPPAPAPELSPEMQYRRDVGSEGVRAADASLNKLVAAGMTDTPKVRFDNSIIANQDPELNPALNKAANAKIKADPNATPETNKAEAEK
jgi:hypothetical protein